jgi:beta-galactosidase
VDDGEDGGGDYYRGEGWYKKKFFADNSLRGLRAYLEFDAANQVTDVWLNGEHIGQHKGGYARFRFDVTAALQYEATNLLTVRVSNAFDANIPPLSGDWTFYGGIYRDVSLLFTKPVHIDVTDYASDGLYLAQHKVSAEQADIGLKVLLRNDGKSDTTIESRATLLDASGKVVLQQSQDQQLSAGEMSVWQSAMRIEKPRLWHGRHDPYLYTVRVSLLSDGQLLDQIEHPLGLRFYHVDPERGFFLNGEPYALYGAALHQDRLGKGWAVNDQDRIEDFDLLDELGVRTLRLAHYQHDELVYRLADERGIILWTELGLVNSISASEEFAESAKQQLKELVRQRYNHPSILFWGLFNEITMRDGPDPVPLARELQTLVKTEDPGRLSAAAVLGNVAGSSSDIWKATDLVAGNVYFGWYYDSVENLSDWVTRVHQTSPATRFAVSEYGAGASESIHSADPIAQDHSEEYQALLHEKSWAKLGQASSLWASYIWAAFDFSSDARNEGSYAGRNNKGLITGDRKIKKDAFYFYKAQWNPEPMVHINGRRFTERTRESSDIKVYANDGTVELKLNGKSLGIKKVDATRILVWEDVELQLGENKIVAIATTEKGEQLRDSIRLQRILNNDTDLASEIMGVDLARRLLVNPPYKLSISALDKVLQRPFGASWELLDAKTSDPFLAVGSTLRVTAANGDSVDYKVISAELSRARNASANRELRKV